MLINKAKEQLDILFDQTQTSQWALSFKETLNLWFLIWREGNGDLNMHLVWNMVSNHQRCIK